MVSLFYDRLTPKIFRTNGASMEGKTPDDEAYSKFFQLTGMHCPKSKYEHIVEDDIAGKSLAEIWNVGGVKHNNPGSRAGSLKVEETLPKRSPTKLESLFSRNNGVKTDNTTKADSSPTKTTSPRRIDSLKLEAPPLSNTASKLPAAATVEVTNIPVTVAKTNTDSASTHLKALKTSNSQSEKSELDDMFDELISLSESNDNDDTEEKNAKRQRNQQKLALAKKTKQLVSSVKASVKKGLSKLKTKRRSKQDNSEAEKTEPDWDQSYVSQVEDSSDAEPSEDQSEEPSATKPRRFSFSRNASENETSDKKLSQRRSLRKSTELSSESETNEADKSKLRRTLSVRKNSITSSATDPQLEGEADKQDTAIRRLLSPRKSSVSLSSTPKFNFPRHLEERLDAELFDDLLLITMLLIPGGDDGPEHYQVV